MRCCASKRWRDACPGSTTELALGRRVARFEPEPGRDAARIVLRAFADAGKALIGHGPIRAAELLPRGMRGVTFAVRAKAEHALGHVLADEDLARPTVVGSAGELPAAI